MKFLFVAVVAGLLTGCASEPWRFGTARDITEAAQTNQTAAVNSPSGDTSVEMRSQSPGPHPFGLIDSLTDRLPSLLSGTAYDTPRFESYPRSAELYSQEFMPGAAAAADYPDRLASYSAPLSPNTAGPAGPVSHGDVVYMPDPQNGSLPPGQPPIWVGVDGQRGEAVGVVINDNQCQNDPTFFERIRQSPFVYNFVNDERNFYSCCSMEWLAVGLGTSAVLANTNLDEQFRQAVHGPANSHNNSLMWAKDLGTGQYVIPGLLGIYAVDSWIDSGAAPGERPVAEALQQWSGRSLRGLTVGAVPVLALQYAIGSSRPGESSAGSKWKPFQDNNGVSGHAFVGAVPFWTAAQMTDNIPLEAAFYAGGTLAGISRIHDDAHFLSQVVMGWWIAGLSVAAVDCTEWQKRQWQVMPMIMENGTGIGVTHEW